MTLEDTDLWLVDQAGGCQESHRHLEQLRDQTRPPPGSDQERGQQEAVHQDCSTHQSRNSQGGDHPGVGNPGCWGH